jgi:5-methylcytosine-specific restriction endonuclease McrA
MKQCRKCKEWKESNEFYPDNGTRDKLHSYCIKCSNLVSRIYHDKNKKKRNRQSRDYHHTHKDQKSSYLRKWRSKNRKRELDYKKRYHSEHAAEEKYKRRIYYSKHPEKTLANNHARRARIKGNGGKFSGDDIRRQYKSQNGLCWWCGKPFVKGNTRLCQSVDHIFPSILGGRNDPSNIVLAHKGCNSKKGKKMPWEVFGRLI